MLLVGVEPRKGVVGLRMSVASSLTVGEISEGTAVLTSDSLEMLRMPLGLLPQPLSVGASAARPAPDQAWSHTLCHG